MAAMRRHDEARAPGHQGEHAMMLVGKGSSRPVTVAAAVDILLLRHVRRSCYSDTAVSMVASS